MKFIIDGEQIDGKRTAMLIEPRWTGLDRTYIVFIGENSLYVAKGGGQFYYLDEKLLKEYIDMNVSREQFLRIDKFNFIISKDDISLVSYNRKKTWWTGSLPNHGTLTIIAKDTKKKKFILHHANDSDNLIKVLQGFFGDKMTIK
jgi:hypothetical protein